MSSVWVFGGMSAVLSCSSTPSFWSCPIYPACNYWEPSSTKGLLRAGPLPDSYTGLSWAASQNKAANYYHTEISSHTEKDCSIVGVNFWLHIRRLPAVNPHWEIISWENVVLWLCTLAIHCNYSGNIIISLDTARFLWLMEQVLGIMRAVGT